MILDMHTAPKKKLTKFKTPFEVISKMRCNFRAELYPCVYVYDRVWIKLEMYRQAGGLTNDKRHQKKQHNNNGNNSSNNNNTSKNDQNERFYYF